jgi:hypothetical protein
MAEVAIVLKKFKCVPKNMPKDNDDGKGATMDLKQVITAESYKVIGNKVVFYDGPLRMHEIADGSMAMMKIGENIVAKLDNPDNWDITEI